VAGPEAAPAATSLVNTAIQNGTAPGAVLAAGVGHSEPLLLHAAGDAQRDGSCLRPMTVGTVFDLASLTKVIATLPCVLHLVAGGAFGLDDPVARYLPGFTGAGKDQVTVRHLLAHTSGLPSDRDYPQVPARRGTDRRAAIVAAALAEPLIARPGGAYAYSDVGFIALGELVAAVTGHGLDEVTRELVCAPLGMAARYLPPREWAGGIAATEIVDGAAKAGVVHDENAEALGGVAGHAGLFGTAADLARYASWWAAGPAGGPAVPAWLRDEALRCQTGGLAGRRGLGWVLPGDRWDNMGDGWPASGAGHTGFTGTSLSFDPRTGLWAVLLTNAVHFGRGPGHSVVALRKQVHAAVAAELLGLGRPRRLSPRGAPPRPAVPRPSRRAPPPPPSAP
jgi:CubicO group peptidase (beta-lactamase class C family)